MPRGDNNRNVINKELQKWLSLSLKMKNSATVIYGKLRANLGVLESIYTKDELNEVSSDMGKIKN